MNNEPKIDYSKTLERSPEEIRADMDAQAETAAKLSHLVPDSVAYAYFLANVRKKPETSESLFWQGRFTEAADLAIGQNKQEYLEFSDALVDLDQPLCNCPPVQFANNVSAKGSSVPSKREIQRVYVAVLKKEVKFVRCDVCQKLYAQTV